MTTNAVLPYVTATVARKLFAGPPSGDGELRTLLRDAVAELDAAHWADADDDDVDDETWTSRLRHVRAAQVALKADDLPGMLNAVYSFWGE